MNALKKIAFYLDRRDEVPNQELARELAANADAAGIREIAENLGHKNKAIASDCIKVLYELGYLKPELIAEYTPRFLELLASKQNRMVWGGMIALSTVVNLQPGPIWEQRNMLRSTIEKGSVITEVAGILTLARLAALKTEYNKVLTPFLFDSLENCRAVDFAKRLEVLYPMVTKANRKEFLRIIREKKPLLNQTRQKRVDKLLKKWGKE